MLGVWGGGERLSSHPHALTCSGVLPGMTLRMLLAKLLLMLLENSLAAPAAALAG